MMRLWQSGLFLLIAIVAGGSTQGIPYESFRVPGPYFFSYGQLATDSVLFISSSVYGPYTQASIFALGCDAEFGCAVLNSFSAPLTNSHGIGIKMTYNEGLLVSSSTTGLVVFDCRNITECFFSLSITDVASEHAPVAINSNNILASMDPNNVGGGSGLYTYNCTSPSVCDLYAYIPLDNFPYTPVGANYGTSIVWMGDFLLVGGPNAVNGDSTGAVVVFDFSNLGNIRLVSILLPTIGQNFGVSMAAYGTTLVVGSPSFTPGIPSHVYLYECINSVCEIQKTIDSNDKTFGSAVNVFGDTLVISQVNQNRTAYHHESGIFFLYDCPNLQACELVEALSPNPSIFNDSGYVSYDSYHSIGMNDQLLILGLPIAKGYQGQMLLLDRADIIPSTANRFNLPYLLSAFIVSMLLFV